MEYNDPLIIDDVVKKILRKLKIANPMEFTEKQAWSKLNELCIALKKATENYNKDGEE